MATRLKTADTSVVVPGLTSWHVAHTVSLAALAGVTSLPAHAMLECFSVLTRLPGGRALPAAEVSARLAEEFPEPPLILSGGDHHDLLARLGRMEIVGGAAYDAVVGMSAHRAGAVLVSRDIRARRTYELLGVEVEMVG